MRFHNPGASVFVPDERPARDAFRRVTHLGIGAHPDDLEFMAMHGILEHFRDPTRHSFGGVIVCDGATGADTSLPAKRKKEQQKAAVIGQYAAVAMLDYPSDTVRKGTPGLAADIKAILEHARPQVVYTHNPADKHPTHIAVLKHVIEALRALPAERHPEKVYGCEVWRGLDWLPDREKVRLDVSDFPEVSEKLVKVFESQAKGGKRYPLAVPGRWQANATFDDPNKPDAMRQVVLAMDLTRLIQDSSMDIAEFTEEHITRFKDDVVAQIQRTEDTPE